MYFFSIILMNYEWFFKPWYRILLIFVNFNFDFLALYMMWYNTDANVVNSAYNLLYSLYSSDDVVM